MSRSKERSISQILAHLLSGLGFKTRKKCLWTLIRSDQQVIDTLLLSWTLSCNPFTIKETKFTYMILLLFSFDNAININAGRLLFRIVGQLSL
jgi:hypothetical protein